MFAFVLFTLLTLNSLDLDHVRYSFNKVDSLKEIETLLEILQNDSSVEAQGYIAALTILKSRFYTYPFKKLKYFNKGKRALEILIDENYGNPELHYLRFSIQISVPKFLGYNSSINEDLLLLKNQSAMDSLNKKTHSIILENILSSGQLSNEDSLYFTKIKNEL